jgi:hypothetical protein
MWKQKKNKSQVRFHRRAGGRWINACG